MKALHMHDCRHHEVATLERVRHFPRQLLTVDDMDTDQDYFREKLRRHNRFLHGWGVVCGLEVLPAPAEDACWRVRITPGYALGPYGDEIFVPDPVYVDLAKCGPAGITDPCEPDMALLRDVQTAGTILYIAIKYEECLASPVRAMTASCDCDEVACEYSRIRDSFHIDCLTALPQSHQQPRLPLLCDLRKENGLPACPPCPTDPWVVLAMVQLPGQRQTSVNIDNINNVVRRQLLYTTTMLQEQQIHYCCEEIIHPKPAADLEIKKSVVYFEEKGNYPISGKFTITVKNNRPSPVSGVQVVDDLPEPNNVDAWDLSERWTKKDTWPYIANLGILQPGETVELSFSFGASKGIHKNIARVNSDAGEKSAEREFGW